MTVNTLTRRDGPFLGTGVQVLFPFNFKVFAASEVYAFLTEAGVTTGLVQGTDYTVTLNEDQDNSPGGSVTMTEAPAATVDVTLSGVSTLTQPAALPQGGRFSPRVVEDALDRLTLITQQLKDELDAGASPGGVSLSGLPDAADRAGKLLGFDTDGNPVAVAPADGSASALALALVAADGSSTVGFEQAGTGASARLVEDKLREIDVSPEDFGAVGGGVTDDRAAFVLALTALTATGGRLRLKPGRTYRISARLPIPSNVAVVGDGSSTILALATDFANATLTKYGNTACVFDVSGLTVAPYTENENVRVNGVNFEWSGTSGFLVDAIAARNVNGLEVVGNRFTGFPVGCDVRASSLTGLCIIGANHHVGRSCSVDLGSGMQATAIELDNDKVNSVPSYGVQIVGNRIADFVFTGAALAARGMETDGINLQGARTSPAASDYSQGHVVSGNVISNVGEGIDTFAWYSDISRNTISDCYYVGIKVIHGASYNSGQGNVIRRCRFGGIMLAASSSTTCNVAGNNFSGGSIRDMNYLDDVVDANNRQSCIRTDNVGGTNLVIDNLFSGITLDPGDYGNYCIVRESDGQRNDFIDMKFVRKGVLGWTATLNSDNGRITASRPTSFRATQGSVTSIADSSVMTKVELSTAAIDDRTELDAAQNAWQCQIPGKYRVRGTVRFATIASGALIQAQLKLDGVAFKTESAQTSSSNEAVVTVDDIVVVTETQRIQLFAAQSTGGAINAQTADTSLVVEPA